MIARRGVTATCAVVTVLAVSGCSGGSPTPDPSATTSAATTGGTAASLPTTSAPPTCPASPVATTPPTNFPHPTLTRHPATTPRSVADDDLAQQGLAALRTFGGPVATSAFQHYLDATGAYLALPVDGLVSANPALVTELNSVLVSVATDAVRRAAGAAPCTTIDFTSGWLPHDDVADPDWRYALGRFHVQVLGTATREPSAAGARVTYRVAVGDTYDFDPGSTFERFGQLALDGHAADYLVGGLTTPRTAVVTSPAALASPGFG